MDYKATVLLPRTDFPMRAELPRREPELQARWEAMGLYRLLREARRGARKYVLHDGPPYANGNVHIGTGLNKILKDIFVRFHSMRGEDAPFVPGWDCHGLPIENKVAEELGPKFRTADPGEIRARCEAYALKFIDIQRAQFKSLGVLGDWENPYLTMSPSYEAGVLDVFLDLMERGKIHRKLRPIHWCVRDETALAEAEVEYRDLVSPAITVAFPLTPAEHPFTKDGAAIVIWTTTPWTLPANLAIAVHPQADYVLVECAGRRLVLAEALAAKALAKLGAVAVLGKTKGADLAGLTYAHPFMNRTSPVVTADYVTLTDGTGCVHTAPGHGHDDYWTGIRNGLEILNPVRENGVYDERAGLFAGKRVPDVDPEVVAQLRSTGHLLVEERLPHSYPHCWRCHQPIIFRATEQWFIEVDASREAALEAVRRTRWVPGWGETRITSMIQNRPDWCVSRQRLWGVPIPAFFCTGCSRPIVSAPVLRHVRDVYAREGAGAWYTRTARELLGTPPACACGGTEYRKGNDIFDVWFESGSSHRSVVMAHPDLHFPADCYLEGTDQHRGWFQTSMLPSVLTQGVSPYRTCVTHGFVVDDEGEKLSKSKLDARKAAPEGGRREEKAYVLPTGAAEFVRQFGADVVRLWIASVDFTDDIPVSKKRFDEIAEVYRKWRNTLRYLLGSLGDFDAGRPESALWEVDRWLLQRLKTLVSRVETLLLDFDLAHATHEINAFIVTDLSAFYLDAVKDRLYTFAPESSGRRAAQTVCREVVSALARIIAPVLCHTAEEVWGHLPGRGEESVHLATWPVVRESGFTPELDAAWDRLFRVSRDLSREIEKLRAAKSLGKSTEAAVDLVTEDAVWHQTLASRASDLASTFLVSEVRVHLGALPDAVRGTDAPPVSIRVTRSTHAKCERCWNHRADIGRTPAHPTLCARCVAVLAETGQG
ncbi:MAG: isoleucine--tRNA ligase [Candidatus Brocadiae bacterium]|nr:isoleucine--tRNA ligase [Candidatus Brocadiia bacterium]